jgi:hypothetical protein
LAVLERLCISNGTEGSNPSLSAIIKMASFCLAILLCRGGRLNSKGSGVAACPQKLASRTRRINTMSSLPLRHQLTLLKMSYLLRLSNLGTDIMSMEMVPANNKGETGFCDCPECGRDFVNLENWIKENKKLTFSLKCRNCDTELKIENISQKTADQFEDELKKRQLIIKYAVRKLEEEAWEEYIKKFVAALALDAILPEDFNE